jgi:hypothetical protein
VQLVAAGEGLGLLQCGEPVQEVGDPVPHSGPHRGSASARGGPVTRIQLFWAIAS